MARPIRSAPKGIKEEQLKCTPDSCTRAAERSVLEAWKSASRLPRSSEQVIMGGISFIHGSRPRWQPL
ncbi:hypothetical protein NDU88_005218 [Pleurodeles waltl]|uniref:Uncharacterized protein n=1 Tax=Pleurodeles waltl TaxID=8319 RepID=A0AAV7PHX3_PLEWA|nr:hypothetical protein NDU88_005218 [Pleurodeles waltl]